MSFGQKVKGLAHGAVLASACFLMLAVWGCTTKTPPQNPPVDSNKTSLAFEYIRQGTLNAFPLGVSHVNSSFDAAGIKIEPIDSDSNPPLAIIRQNDQIIYDYMWHHTERSSQVEPELDKHLFAAYAFYPPQGDTVDRTTLGLTYYFVIGAECTETVSLVAVTVIRDRISDSNENEAVSGTTVHELGHLTNMTESGITDCSHGQTHQGACAMMDITETGGVLERQCNVDRYNYTNLFCSSCTSSLKLFMTGSPKL